MSSSGSEERVPFAPLEVRIAPDDEVAVCRRLRISTERLERARRIGLSVWTADALAVRAGFHPVEVWGDEWETAADEEVAFWTEVGRWVR